jgi:hypothetical protein
MVTVRRWYIFLVNIVSLQAVTWAIIFLLQNLLTLGSGAPVETTAFQIAVIVIGLPIFLVHWLWAQRLAGRETDELWSAVRRLYLYITLAIFLAAFAINTFDLSETLLRSLLGDSTQRSFTSTSPTEAVVQDLLALVSTCCAGLCFSLGQRRQLGSRVRSSFQPRWPGYWWVFPSG